MTEPTSGGGSAMSTDTARQLAGAAVGEADVLERVAVNTRPDVVRAGNVDWMLGFEAGVGEAVTALRRRAAKRTVGGGQR